MRRLFPAAVVAALVLVAGCSDDEDPQPRIAPTESSSAASSTAPPPTPTPTGPVEPTLPPEAGGEDAAAAEAFVRHYWAMVNYAQATGDLGGLRRMSAPNCAACLGGADEIERVYALGGSMSGGELRIVRTSSQPFVSGPTTGFAVTLKVTVRPQEVAVPGDEPVRYPGGPGKIRMIIEASSGTWAVQRWDSM